VTDTSTPTLDPSRLPRLGVRAFAGIFVLALAARLAMIAVVGFDTVGFGDARAYLAGARALAETGRYPARTDSFFFRPPGYSAFLAAITLGHPDRIAVEKVANAVLGALSSLLLAALSLRIFRDRVVALATGAAAALHPSFLLVCSDIQSEALFLLLLLGCGYLLLAAADRPSTNLALAAGALLGLAALTRASALMLAPFLASPIVCRRYPMRVRTHLAAAGLVGFLFAVAPWTLRNASVFGRFLPVSDMGGSTFYDGNSEWTRRFYGLKSREEYDRWIVALDRDKHERIAALARVDPVAAAQPSEYFGRIGVAYCLAHPGATVALAGRKALDWLRPYPNPWFWPRKVVFSVGLLYSALFALAAFGLAAAPRRGVVRFSLAFLLVTMAVHVALIVVWRYRVPYWDPVLLLYGSFGAVALVRRASP
jgi:4-amino-4-deoxy-L-arabinose transferase-like glycosyltransferase